MSSKKKTSRSSTTTCSSPKRSSIVLPPHECRGSGDVRLTARGRNLQELFVNAMAGMYSALGPRYAREGAEAEVELDGSCSAELLVDFLNELLSRMDLDGEVFRVVSFRRLDEGGLQATLKGKKITGFERAIKSATQHDLRIERKNGFIEAKVLFDA